MKTAVERPWRTPLAISAAWPASARPQHRADRREHLLLGQLGARVVDLDQRRLPCTSRRRRAARRRAAAGRPARPPRPTAASAASRAALLDQRPHLAAGIGRILDRHPRRPRPPAPRAAGRSTGGLADHAAGGGALLAGVAHRRRRDHAGRRLDVGVGQHDRGVLAAHLALGGGAALGQLDRHRPGRPPLEPVNESAATSAWATSAAPVSPSPCTTSSTPSGSRPANSDSAAARRRPARARDGFRRRRCRRPAPAPASTAGSRAGSSRA